MARTKPTLVEQAKARRTDRIEAGIVERGLADVVLEVAREHHVTLREVASMVRSTRAVAARRAVWSRLREIGFSYPEIAAIFETDHSSVMYGVKRAAERVA